MTKQLLYVRVASNQTKKKKIKKIYKGNLRQRSEMQMKTVVYMMSSS